MKPASETEQEHQPANTNSIHRECKLDIDLLNLRDQNRHAKGTHHSCNWHLKQVMSRYFRICNNHFPREHKRQSVQAYDSHRNEYLGHKDLHVQWYRFFCQITRNMRQKGRDSYLRAHSNLGITNSICINLN